LLFSTLQQELEENGELRKTITDITNDRDKFEKEYYELKQENDELKRQLKEYECAEKFPNECHCAFRCLGNEWCDEAENRFIKYKQKLEKIKVLCTHSCAALTNVECERMENCEICGRYGNRETINGILSLLEEQEWCI